MTAQLVTRIDDQLATRLDDLVARGEVESRSDAVRKALWALVDQRSRARVAAAIVDGYRHQPQTVEEVGWADEATVAMISEESW